MQMMESVSEHVGTNFSETPYSIFVAQPVDDFLFPAENHNKIDKDEGF